MPGDSRGTVLSDPWTRPSPDGAVEEASVGKEATQVGAGPDFGLCDVLCVTDLTMESRPIRVRARYTGGGGRRRGTSCSRAPLESVGRVAWLERPTTASACVENIFLRFALDRTDLKCRGPDHCRAEGARLPVEDAALNAMEDETSGWVADGSVLIIVVVCAFTATALGAARGLRGWGARRKMVIVWGRCGRNAGMRHPSASVVVLCMFKTSQVSSSQEWELGGRAYQYEAAPSP